MVKVVNTADLKSAAVRLAGSSPARGTIEFSFYKGVIMKKYEKFNNGDLVKILETSHWRSHGFTEAIIDNSYRRLYGGEQWASKSYSFYPVENNKIIDECAWIEEKELELISKCKIKYLRMISDYQNKEE